MQKREKILFLIAASAVAVWFALPMLEGSLLVPVEEGRARVERLRGEVADKRIEQAKLKGAMLELQRWRNRSLPPNPVDAQRLYLSWLTDLAQLAELSDVTVMPSRRTAKGKIYTAILVTLEGEAKLSQLGRFLHLFHRVDLAHRIPTLTIESPASKGYSPLKFSLVAEGLSFPDVAARTELFPQTTLTDDFRSGSADQTIVVATADGFPQQPGFRVRIGREMLEVVAIDGTKWTVRGGVDGTKASAHRQGDEVELVPIATEYASRSIEELGRFVTMNPFVEPLPPEKPLVRPTPPPTRPTPTPPVARTDDSAAETVLSATIVADGEPEAWLYRRSNSQRTVVRAGQKIDIGVVQAVVQSIAADHLVLQRDDALWKLRLGDTLVTLEKLPQPAPSADEAPAATDDAASAVNAP